MFKALLLEQSDGKVSSSIQSLDESRLPEGDVTLAVECSTLNYKDGMILKGLGRLVRNYPHVPGIDCAGRVIESSHPDWKPGDAAILTGWRVGETHWGGYAEKVRVKGDWLVKLPDGLTAKRAMAIGTAGFTAMLCVMELENNGVRPDAGPDRSDVLVTGAAGGVGSVAIAILAKRGYRVVASTGRAESEGDYLRGLGADEIIDRNTIASPSGKPLDSERWAGCVDAVGGSTLATILPQIRYRGCVAACGLAGGVKLETTVIPFLLRGVRLIGVDSVMCPVAIRHEAWQRLAEDLSGDKIDAAMQTATLEDLPGLADDILAGKVRGRVVVEIGGR